MLIFLRKIEIEIMQVSTKAEIVSSEVKMVPGNSLKKKQLALVKQDFSLN